MSEFKSDANHTILITGAAGLIGWNFVNYLLKNTDHNVIGVDAMADWGNHNPPVDNPRYKFYQLNILSEPDRFDHIVMRHHVNIIYHMASYAAEGLSPFMRCFNYAQNTMVSAVVINAAIRHYCKLIFTSSMSVYGHGVCQKSEYKTFSEYDRPEPIDPYGIAKFGVEQDIKVAGIQHGLEWVIIRPHNVFGIGQNVNDRYRNVIGIWMHQAVNGEPLTIYGDGEQERAFTYVDNIMVPLYKAIEVKNEVINLGGIVGYTINEVCDKVMKITGSKELIHLEARHEVKRAIPNPAKSISILKYKDVIDIDEGLKRMWEWVQTENPVKEWFVWNEFELTNNIYSYWKQ